MALKAGSFAKIRKEKSKWKYSTIEEYEKLEHQLTQELLRLNTPTFTGTVRIIAGKAKGINIDIPRKTRPVTDRMKTHIFDVLREDIHDVTILDLFAGSGAFGLEALSRGAKSAVLIDAASHAEKVLQKNVAKTGFLAEAEVIKIKSEDFLLQSVKNGTKFEVVFIDPPYKWYNKNRFFKVRDLVALAQKVLPGYDDFNTQLLKGALILKHPAKFAVEKLQNSRLSLLQTVVFGMNGISILYLNPPLEGEVASEEQKDEIEVVEQKNEVDIIQGKS